MNWLAPKLNLRVAQKQILTPGLVQMVSVLALNRLELREMINQEIMANPVLEEVAEEGTAAESYTDEAFLKKETEKLPETPAANPFDEFDFGSFFGLVLNRAAEPYPRNHPQRPQPAAHGASGFRHSGRIPDSTRPPPLRAVALAGNGRRH